jgi:short-subunit dehydrogenase
MEFFDTVLLVLGLYALLPRLANLLRLLKLLKHQLSEAPEDPFKPFKNRAPGGENWALVTGCTSGIGEELAKKLASEGFNLFLVSRSAHRLGDLEKAIARQSPLCKTRVIVMDMLSEGCNLDFYRDRITREVIDKSGGELRVIVNNAGVNTRGLFKDISADEVREMALVNTYPYAFLTHSLLPLLKLKPHRKTLVLSICSVISFLPSSYDAIYAATKVFERFQFESIRMENRGLNEIEFLLLHPQYVSTNNARLPPGGLVESTASFVERGVLRIVGKRRIH